MAVSLIFIITYYICAGQVRVLTTDLNNDGKLDSIILNSSNSVTISLSGFPRQPFTTKYSWTEVDSAFLATNKNDIQSKELFLKKVKGQSVILLFGNLDGAGYREGFSIINIEGNKAKMVFDNDFETIDVEIPTTSIDLNNDGKLDFVFRGLGEIIGQVDSLNANIETYHPYQVYTVDANCALNKELTKKYNEDHYVFAGYEYSEKIKILYPRNDGKPSVMK